MPEQIAVKSPPKASLDYLAVSRGKGYAKKKPTSQGSEVVIHRELQRAKARQQRIAARKKCQKIVLSDAELADARRRHGPDYDSMAADLGVSVVWLRLEIRKRVPRSAPPDR